MKASLNTYSKSLKGKNLFLVRSVDSHKIANEIMSTLDTFQYDSGRSILWIHRTNQLPTQPISDQLQPKGRSPEKKKCFLLDFVQISSPATPFIYWIVDIQKVVKG